MGGRGTFAAGKSVDYTYETVGYVEGIKVLKGIDGTGKHGLPESAHSSLAYIKLKPDGTFHEMRFYDKNHILYLEIGYHPEPSLTGNNQTNVLHYHTYNPSFSLTKEGNGGRSKANRATAAMRRRFKRFFVGVK
jgi:hypothetical protein